VAHSLKRNDGDRERVSAFCNVLANSDRLIYDDFNKQSMACQPKIWSLLEQRNQFQQIISRMVTSIPIVRY